jgi:hypothetical protein
MKKAIVALTLILSGNFPFTALHAEEVGPVKRINYSLSTIEDSPLSALPEEAPRRMNYSLNIGGGSNHNTGGQPNTFNQTNPHIGFRIWGKEEILGGSPYFEANYIHRNSVDGKTFTVGSGIQWTIIRSPEINLCGGVQAFYMRYENRRLGETWDGVLAAPYLCLEKNNYSFNIVRLGPDVIFMYFSKRF